MSNKLLVGLAGGILLVSGCSLADSSTSSSTGAVPVQTVENAPTSTTVTVLVPKDQAGYETAMNKFVQEGGVKNPATSWVFEQKTVSVPYSSSTVFAVAEYSARLFGQVQDHALVYFKVVGETAYVVKRIDLDGYAGSSVAIAKINPVVEKNLLAQPGIKKVVFDVAPGDSRDELMKLIQSSP